MAGPFYVDDGGNGSDGLSWANAYTSINAADVAQAFAVGESIYFGHDHQCQATNSANLTITLPATGNPAKLISCTQGSSPPAYQKGTGAQIDTTEGAYNIVFDGSFAAYGLKLVSGAAITLSSDTNESGYAKDCTFALGAGGTLTLGGAGKLVVEQCVIDLSADGTTGRTGAVINGLQSVTVRDLTFINAGYRTGTVFGAVAPGFVSGCDFSGFSNGTLCELVANTANIPSVFVNCKTAATWALVQGNALTAQYGRVEAYNVGPTDDPSAVEVVDYSGRILSSSAIYRTGGATVEGVNTSWGVVTTAVCADGIPLYSPWIVGQVGSTGSRTFDLFIVNDTADLTDADIALEIEAMGTSDSPLATVTSDAAVILATPAAQTDDTVSTWNGIGPAFTYKQKLSVAKTVGETGLFRARVVVSKTSIAAGANLYLDPKVIIS